MVTYICKGIISDAIGREMSEDVVTASDINISVLDTQTDNLIFTTLLGKPNNNAWESGGTITFELNITATNGGGAGTWRARCRVQMRDIGGNLLENGVQTAFQGVNTTGVKTYSIAVPTWTATQSCTNRISINIQFQNISGSTRTATIQVGDANSECISPISEDAAACRRIFIS